MRNINKYEKEIKELIEKKGYFIAIDKKTNKLKDCCYMSCRDCLFSDKEDKCIHNAPLWLMKEYKEPPILNEAEKKYLENVLRPFKNKIIYAKKSLHYETLKDEECIWLRIGELGAVAETIKLPWFKLGTMYKGMEIGKYYTAKDLGLFEGE